MPKVAMLAHTYYLRDPRVRREAEALAEKGFEVHVICLSEGRNGHREPRYALVNGVQIHRLPIRRRRGGFLKYFFQYLFLGGLCGLGLGWFSFPGKLSVVYFYYMAAMFVFGVLISPPRRRKVVLDVHYPLPGVFL